MKPVELILVVAVVGGLGLVAYAVTRKPAPIVVQAPPPAPAPKNDPFAAGGAILGGLEDLATDFFKFGF